MIDGIEIRHAASAEAQVILAMNERVSAKALFFLTYEMDPAIGGDMLCTNLAEGPDGDLILRADEKDSVIDLALRRDHLDIVFYGEF